MKLNGDRSLGEIQAGIERTRSDLNETLSAIEHRLTPRQLVDQGIDYLRHSGTREYEQPLALGAIGIAVGAVLAAAAPRTRQEDNLMGHASDRYRRLRRKRVNSSSTARPPRSERAPTARSTRQATRSSQAGRRLSSSSRREYLPKVGMVMAASVGEARGPRVDRPRDLSASGWWDLLLRVKDQVAEDRLTIIAAGVAFYALLAVFPALATPVSVLRAGVRSSGSRAATRVVARRRAGAGGRPRV